MFKFLKDKLKDAVGKFTKDVEEAVEETPSSKTDVVEEAFKEEVEVTEEKKEPVKETPKEEKLKTQRVKKDSSIQKSKTSSESKPKPSPKKTVKKESKKPIETKEEKEIDEPEPAKKDYETKIVEKSDEKEEKIIEEKPKEVKDDDIQEEISEPEEKEIAQQDEKKKGFFSKLLGKNIEETSSSKTNVEEATEEKAETVDEEKEKPKKEGKKGFFSKVTETVTKKKLSEDKFDELFWDIELALLESNIAVEVIDKIKEDLKVALVGDQVSMFKTQDIVFETLQKSIGDLLTFDEFNILSKTDEKKPYIIAFIGVNGSGKTTNLAKLANYLKNNGKEVVIAACDTFRAAAIQQIEDHANNLGIKLIKHDYGSDAAAVAFDAIDHAKAKGKDFVLIDTAGRNQSNKNLMEELSKLVRVAKPDLKIFVGDSLTGNDAVEQAKEFNEAVGIDGIILSKVDADEKGGASVSISYVAKKPIFFVGNGQGYDDLIPFKKEEFLEKMGL
ncbi:signal recognition particle-docking protein FtsY [Candidatus Woesearchaeota archaeon]|nr:MAG: signal recognition particle-docking protein FtsY [Candidatus Woesearchaeota archaeon]